MSLNLTSSVPSQVYLRVLGCSKGGRYLRPTLRIWSLAAASTSLSNTMYTGHCALALSATRPAVPRRPAVQPAQPPTHCPQPWPQDQLLASTEMGCLSSLQQTTGTRLSECEDRLSANVFFMITLETTTPKVKWYTRLRQEENHIPVAAFEGGSLGSHTHTSLLPGSGGGGGRHILSRQHVSSGPTAVVFAVSSEETSRLSVILQIFTKGNTFPA